MKKLQTTWAPPKDLHNSEHSCSSSPLEFSLMDKNPNAELGACIRSSVTCPPSSLNRSQLCGSWNTWWWDVSRELDPGWVEGSWTSCRAKMAARFSAISSRSAALGDENQVLFLDDRRERARPVDKVKLQSISALIKLLSIEKECTCSGPSSTFEW